MTNTDHCWLGPTYESCAGDATHDDASGMVEGRFPRDVFIIFA
jgi:hypothetical protein